MYPVSETLRIIAYQNPGIEEKIISQLSLLAPNSKIINKQTFKKYWRLQLQTTVYSVEHRRNIFAQIGKVEDVVTIL